MYVRIIVWLGSLSINCSNQAVLVTWRVRHPQIFKLPISIFMCTFDKCGFLLEHNIMYICSYNATSSLDNIIANSLPNMQLSKVSIFIEMGNYMMLNRSIVT